MSEETKTQSMRTLPQVDKVLRHERMVHAQQTTSREVLARLTRDELSRQRQSLSNGESLDDLDAIIDTILARLERLHAAGIKRVLNGTGVILNTNLGRAPLGTTVVERIAAALPGYSNLEISLASGKRGERTAVLEELLSILIGSERAIVVNNNAAAVMLAVGALASGKEVIVSRGELIEIGGSFRLPDVIVAAGGRLREVGTTNRTRIADYRSAVNEQTGLILKCHRSNFAITGFTEEVSLAELVQVGKETGVPVMEDLGSGAIVDLSKLGLADEPTVGSVIEAGIDAVLFSGDKLLGGVQAGIIAGKKTVVERMRKYPIYRALRADKLILTVLEGTLAQYLSNQPEKSVPAMRMASLTQDELQHRVDALVARMQGGFKNLRCSRIATVGAFGGGTLPSAQLPGWGVHVSAPGFDASVLAARLRGCEPPVVAIVSDEKVTIDLRTILPEEEESLVAALTQMDQSLALK